MSNIHRTKAKPCWLDGIRFASEAERDRYAYLLQLTQEIPPLREIKDLVLQPEYVLFNQGGLTIKYVADFRYQRRASGIVVVEDVKGLHTEVYRLKRRMFLALYPNVEFYEITDKPRRLTLSEKGRVVGGKKKKAKAKAARGAGTGEKVPVVQRPSGRLGNSWRKVVGLQGARNDG